MTHDEQVALVEAKLNGSLNDWQNKVFSLILKIPSGYLISYGHLAQWANREYDLKINAQNTAWLRKRLYDILGHETDVPIHRIATQGDAESTKDHPYTQQLNQEKRILEGTYPTPKWWTEWRNES